MMAFNLRRPSNGAFTLPALFVRRVRPEGRWKPGLLVLLVLSGAGMLRSAQKQPAQQFRGLPAPKILERAHTEFTQGDYANARRDYLKALPSFPDRFDILKDLGYCYFVTGPQGYADAAKYYERAFQANPRSSEVGEKLSQCYFGLKEYRKAAEIDTKLARSAKASAQAWKRAGQAYEAAGDHAQARQAYIAYLQRKPGDLLGRCQLARLQGLDKDYTGAAAQYGIVLSSNPDFIPALVGMGRILSWEGQLDRSLEFYNHALRFEPDNGAALTGKAFTLLWQKRYRQAKEIFESLHRRYPRDPEVDRGLEQARRGIESSAFASARKNGTASELIDYYRKQVAGNPQDVEALKALAALNADVQHCGQAAAFGSKAIEASGGSTDARLAAARSLRTCGNYTEAASYYRQYLQSHPGAKDVQYELGDTLRRAGRFQDSLRAFRRLLQSDPRNPDAQVGLGQSLAATGHFDEALARFNEVLDKNPGYYDALQGKAYVLFWKSDFGRARSIFEALEKRDPGDPQNTQALKEIAQAEETAHRKALRPAADSSPQAWVEYFREILASQPKDRTALKGLAYQESQLNDRNAAIGDYRHVLLLYPDDRDSKLELARLLSLDGNYSEAIGLYRRALRQDPQDTNTRASLARVLVWSGQPQEALAIYQHLLSQDPSNTGYLLETARLEIRMKEYDAARENLGSLLAIDPANRNARLELARLNTQQGNYSAALEDYDAVLKRNPQDPAALLGKARISFYQGKLAQAHAAATEAIEKQPKDFSSVFLLASIEHAQHHRRKTLSLLDRADKLSPGDAQVASLRNRVLSESRVTLRTTVAYAREIGPASQSNGRTGLPNEDLRMYTYGTTIGFPLFPRTNSYVSFTSVPADSPPGPLRDSNGNQVPTGITGATAPYEFLYRQSTRFNRRFTVRGGAGYVRFGPGAPVSIPGQSGLIQGAAERPVGLAGISIGLSRRLSIDLDATKSGITYTPLSSRLGVIEDRLRGRINYFFDPRTDIHLAYWYGRYTSEEYSHTLVVNGVPQDEVFADHDQGRGGSILFNRQVLHSSGFSLDAGYEGYIYGFAGQARNVFLGFFNPGFYQRHEFVPRVFGPLWGPIGYDLSGGIGIQQTGRGGPVTRAWNVSPSFSFRVSRHLRLIFGYTHYNTAQILGALRGNEVRFNTEWQY